MMNYTIQLKTKVKPNFAPPRETGSFDRHDTLLRCQACRLKYEFHTLTLVATHYICKFCMKDWEVNSV